MYTPDHQEIIRQAEIARIQFLRALPGHFARFVAGLFRAKGAPHTA